MALTTYAEGMELRNEQDRAVLFGACTTHRTDEFTIIRKIARLMRETADVPEFIELPEGGFRRVKSRVDEAGRIKIMRDHEIQDLAVYAWFASRAEELLALSAEGK